LKTVFSTELLERTHAPLLLDAGEVQLMLKAFEIMTFEHLLFILTLWAHPRTGR
jgi:hypothetical protein